MQARQVMSFLAATADVAQCAECAAHMGASAARAEAFKSEILQQREDCRNLLGNTTLLYLSEGDRYALVPRAWLAQWRRWIWSSPWKEQGALSIGRAPAGNAPPAVARPPPLAMAIAEFTTSVNGERRLLTELPPLKAHRGDKWCQVQPRSPPNNHQHHHKLTQAAAYASARY